MEEEFSGVDVFGGYWFGSFGVVAILDRPGPDGVGLENGIADWGDRDWEKECLGTFYVKPNYPGMLAFPVRFYCLGYLHAEMLQVAARMFVMRVS